MVTNVGFKLLGSLNIPNGECYVSDPTYSTDTWCNWKLENMIPGEYECYYCLSDQKDFGIRVGAIKIVHHDYRNGPIYFDEIPDEDVHIGVDSATCGFIITDVTAGKLMSHDKIGLVYDKIDDNKEARCCIIPGLGFFSDSGLGDGDYFLYVATDEYRDNKVYAALIDYDIIPLCPLEKKGN